MRIALCLSGQPRFYNHPNSYGQLKNKIMDRYQKNDHVDVFIHTWVFHNKTTEQLYETGPWNYVKVNELEYNSEKIQTELTDLYSPKAFLAEEPISNKEATKDQDTNASYMTKNMPSMFYSMMMADQLRRQYSQQLNFEYDIVIRARTDTWIQSELPDLVKLEKDKLYVPDDCPCVQYFNDNFSIATSSAVADKAYDLYKYLDTYSIETKYHPEHTWTTHLQQNNIDVIKRKDIQINMVRSIASS